jgi:23S rRNA U2552 (ribose-2'-O)-methylase RlmE/FtsJ
MKHLQEIYQKYSETFPGGGDKGTIHSYINAYETLMDKKSKIKLLEIGVRSGHSIALWKDYFEESSIIGIDIDISQIIFNVSENVHICDATDYNQIQELFGDASFDYIIDDGSHSPLDQVISFEILWSRIKAGGKYFIEDIQGETELKKLKDYLLSKNVSFEVLDFRAEKNRYDDILIVITKS